MANNIIVKGEEPERENVSKISNRHILLKTEAMKNNIEAP